jgi:hypothetical protein
VLLLAGMGQARAAPIAVTNPQFATVYEADPSGNCVYSGGNPVSGTMTPSSYTDGLSPVHISTLTDIPTLGTWSSITFTDGSHYSNQGSQSAMALLVPGWVQSTPGNQGVQVAGAGMFHTGQNTFLYVNGPGFGGPAGGIVVYQDLGPAGSILAPNTQYTFNVDVGARGDSINGNPLYPLASPIVAGLYVGAAPSVAYTMSNGATSWTLPNELSLLSESITLPDAGAFDTWTKTYTTGASVPGGDVYLILGTINDAPVTGDQVDFTNVQLNSNASPNDLTGTPEPMTLSLFGLAGAALVLYSSSLRGRARPAKALAGMLTVSHLALRRFRLIR